MMASASSTVLCLNPCAEGSFLQLRRNATKAFTTIHRFTPRMCTTGHTDLKANTAALRQHTVLVAPERDENGTVLWYLRNCLLCGSTLCIEPALEDLLTQVET
jgi:hypothetical protein